MTSVFGALDQLLAQGLDFGEASRFEFALEYAQAATALLMLFLLLLVQLHHAAFPSVSAFNRQVGRKKREDLSGEAAAAVEQSLLLRAKRREERLALVGSSVLAGVEGVGAGGDGAIVQRLVPG